MDDDQQQPPPYPWAQGLYNWMGASPHEQQAVSDASAAAAAKLRRPDLPGIATGSQPDVRASRDFWLPLIASAPMAAEGIGAVGSIGRQLLQQYRNPAFYLREAPSDTLFGFEGMTPEEIAFEKELAEPGVAEKAYDIYRKRFPWMPGQGSKVGEVSASTGPLVEEAEGPGTAYIEYFGSPQARSASNSLTGGMRSPWAQSYTAGQLRNLAQQFREMNPGVTRLAGNRISGARSELPSGAGYGYANIRP